LKGTYPDWFFQVGKALLAQQALDKTTPDK